MNTKEKNMKSKTTAYLLCIFFGFLGAHKFYLRKPGMGILYWLTAAIFGIGWLYDLFTLGKQVDQFNKNQPDLSPNYENQENTSLKNEKDKSIFIEYEDSTGNFSDRTIEIKRVYKKGGKLYIDAYCFLAGDDRTFLVDRIVTMKDKYKGNIIVNIQAYLNQFMYK